MVSAMSKGTKLSIDEVMKRLPHRYPFLFLDQVLECKPGKSVRATKNITINEPFFIGHFPGHPVMPGVLVIEAMAQAGGLLAWESVSAEERDFTMYLVGVDKARFKRPVFPGDQLILSATLLTTRRELWRFDCKAEVDGLLAVGAEILLAPQRTL